MAQSVEASAPGTERHEFESHLVHYFYQYHSPCNAWVCSLNSSISHVWNKMLPVGIGSMYFVPVKSYKSMLPWILWSALKICDPLKINPLWAHSLWSNSSSKTNEDKVRRNICVLTLELDSWTSKPYRSNFDPALWPLNPGIDSRLLEPYHPSSDPDFLQPLILHLKTLPIHLQFCL